MLADIGTDAANGNNANTSAIDEDDLNALTGVSGAIGGNVISYRAAIAANEGPFNSPATEAEVQAMIDAVNVAATASAEALAEVLEDSNSAGGANNANGTAVTAAQLAAITGIMNIDPANEAAYQSAIASETGFSNPPTVAEVQGVINEANNVSAVVTSSTNNTLTQQELTDAGITQTGLSQEELDTIAIAISNANPAPSTTEAVSYTHLTLPTILLV